MPGERGKKELLTLKFYFISLHCAVKENDESLHPMSLFVCSFLVADECLAGQKTGGKCFF